MAKFDLNDSGVVVIVGSGAGGGTLGNELAQKGIKVVILEAGPRIENHDFVNDEWESFSQLAWSDMRTTSGSWRVAKDFPNLPAWIVKAVGGSTTTLPTSSPLCSMWWAGKFWQRWGRLATISSAPQLVKRCMISASTARAPRIWPNAKTMSGLRWTATGPIRSW